MVILSNKCLILSKYAIEIYPLYMTHTKKVLIFFIVEIKQISIKSEVVSNYHDYFQQVSLVLRKL